MANSIYFIQECPTCGINLQVRIEYLGKAVVCQHCGANLEACDPSTGEYPPSESSTSLLARAEELLETASASQVGATD
jgi:lysine biosynthesis protein LysW